MELGTGSSITSPWPTSANALAVVASESRTPERRLLANWRALARVDPWQLVVSRRWWSTADDPIGGLEPNEMSDSAESTATGGRMIRIDGLASERLRRLSTHLPRRTALRS